MAWCAHSCGSSWPYGGRPRELVAERCRAVVVNECVVVLRLVFVVIGGVVLGPAVFALVAVVHRVRVLLTEVDVVVLSGGVGGRAAVVAFLGAVELARRVLRRGFADRAHVVVGQCGPGVVAARRARLAVGLVRGLMGRALGGSTTQRARTPAVHHAVVEPALRARGISGTGHREQRVVITLALGCLTAPRQVPILKTRLLALRAVLSGHVVIGVVVIRGLTRSDHIRGNVRSLHEDLGEFRIVVASRVMFGGLLTKRRELTWLIGTAAHATVEVDDVVLITSVRPVLNGGDHASKAIDGHYPLAGLELPVR
jgi:hypothetical protein